LCCPSLLMADIFALPVSSLKTKTKTKIISTRTNIFSVPSQLILTRKGNVSFHVMSHCVTSCHIVSHHVTSCHIMSHHVTSCHIAFPRYCKWLCHVSWLNIFTTGITIDFLIWCSKHAIQSNTSFNAETSKCKIQ
jgi:hypothetical protein